MKNKLRIQKKLNGYFFKFWSYIKNFDVLSNKFVHFSKLLEISQLNLNLFVSVFFLKLSMQWIFSLVFETFFLFLSLIAPIYHCFFQMDVLLEFKALKAWKLFIAFLNLWNFLKLLQLFPYFSIRWFFEVFPKNFFKKLWHIFFELSQNFNFFKNFYLQSKF